ncbi:retrovirus-related pol polyprotein from transposon TNT 1-94 [Tanacetum coccineum]
MQDEIHEFNQLQVWELALRPKCVMIIALKWIYKVKLDEYGDVLKNKARLVAKGYRQEEGINFEEFYWLHLSRLFDIFIAMPPVSGFLPTKKALEAISGSFGISEDPVMVGLWLSESTFYGTTRIMRSGPCIGCQRPHEEDSRAYSSSISCTGYGTHALTDDQILCLSIRMGAYRKKQRYMDVEGRNVSNLQDCLWTF